MLDFRNFTTEELLSIWDRARRNQWNDLLGPEPDGFDDLPETRKKGFFRRKVSLVKHDYTYPVLLVVSALLPAEKIDMHIQKQMTPAEHFIKNCIGFKVGSKELQPILGHFAKTQGWK